MSQVDFIRSTVSDFFDALIDSDLADLGGYIELPGADPFPCRVLLRRGVRPFGEFGRAPGQGFEMRIVNADAVVQKSGAVVTITSEALGMESFKLVEKLDDNGALTTWSVIRA
jgi:hypothetical protein